MKHLKLDLNQRAVLVRDGHAVKALGPGRYTLWKLYDVVTFDTDKLAFTAPDVVLAGLPADWYETVQLAPRQYGIVTRDERAVAFLRPGVHRLWKVDRNVALRVFDEIDPLPALDDDLRKLIPASELRRDHARAEPARRPRARWCARARPRAGSSRVLGHAQQAADLEGRRPRVLGAAGGARDPAGDVVHHARRSVRTSAPSWCATPSRGCSCVRVSTACGRSTRTSRSVRSSSRRWRRRSPTSCARSSRRRS